MSKSNNPNRKNRRDRRRERHRDPAADPIALHTVPHPAGGTVQAIAVVPGQVYATQATAAVTIGALIIAERDDLLKQVPLNVLRAHPPRCEHCGSRLQLPFLGERHAEYERAVRGDDPAA